MIVSMMVFRLLLSQAGSLKDKRQAVLSVKDKLHKKFKLSVAEVADNDHHTHAIIGAAYVTNSKTHGESVLHKAVDFLESVCGFSLADVEIYTETYG